MWDKLLMTSIFSLLRRIILHLLWGNIVTLNQLIFVLRLRWLWRLLFNSWRMTLLLQRRYISLWRLYSSFLRHHIFWGFFLLVGEHSLLHLWHHFFLQGGISFSFHGVASSIIKDILSWVCIHYWGEVTLFLFLHLPIRMIPCPWSLIHFHTWTCYLICNLL